MNPPVAIKRRERDAVLQSLQAGLVPKQGLHLIQVGRKAEVSALLQDLERLCDEGASFRIVVGRFGSGKSFFLNLVRNVAFQKKLVVAQADFSMERRLYASGGEARGLYSELMRNLATKAQPDGAALPSVLSAWISQVQYGVLNGGGTTDDVERRLGDDLRSLQDHVGGFEFAEVVRAFYRGHVEKDDALQAAALRWLRGEYTTTTEARGLGVGDATAEEFGAGAGVGMGVASGETLVGAGPPLGTLTLLFGSGAGSGVCWGTRPGLTVLPGASSRSLIKTVSPFFVIP